MMLKLNRVIGFILAAALLYAVLQHWGLLPDWAPKPFPRPTGPPAA
jgi:hypothetical protein